MNSGQNSYLEMEETAAVKDEGGDVATRGVERNREKKSRKDLRK